MAMLRRASLSLGRFASTIVAAGRGTALSMPLSSQCRSLPLISLVLCRVYSDGGVHKVIVDSSNQETRRRLLNRLLYRSKQRGFLELDLVLGKWMEEHLNSLDETRIKHLVQLLDLENPDLWKWLTSQEPPLETVSMNHVFSAIQKKVMNNLNSYTAPETRAMPGQPWVRGWDDFKRGRDSPISGNQ